ncbi:DDT domain-containing protein DDB_G0282237 isoform X1 [Fagus crenata]
MPLLKKKPFSLAKPPKDLDPRELVYQVRFTKEIFRDYQEYLNRINLYRQRVWACKVTGKTSLTYEEALVSEKRAVEMVQQFPKELMAPALHIIQYSMLSLKDLANTIAETMQKRLFVGAELYGRKENDVFACKITKVLEGPDKIQYEVAWLDKNKKVMEHSLVSREDLIQKKAPFSRNVLKSFIRDSTYRSAPWVIHDKLARNHGISTDLPEELRSQVIFKDGLLVRNMEGKNKRKKIDGERFDGSSMERTKKGDDQQMKEPIKYPIDDLLVQPGADDPIFTDCPSPLRDFNVPLDCVGDLLMVWDFCSSFGRLLQLSPFSLEDFENAICHKDSNQILLLVETHSALLRLLIKDNGEYLLALGKRNKKLKITLINWTEYLCDFLEMIKLPEFTYTATIKRGHYGLLDAHAKLGILRELINQAIQTDIFREKLDSVIEEQQELGATRRGEAIEEARKKREEKEHLKAEADANGVMDQQFLGSVESVAANDNHSKQNGHIEKKRNGKVQQGNALENCETKLSNTASKKKAKKQNLDVEVAADNGKDSSRKEGLKQLKDDKKEAAEKMNKEQRREFYEREMEKRVIHRNPLGKDKFYNRYWWFHRDGRIFVESSDSKEWGYYSSKEELDALMGSLNIKGEREWALKKQLEKFHSRICKELQKRSKEFAHKIAMEEAVVRRSTRVRAPPRENPANAFLRYVNKWKED